MSKPEDLPEHEKIGNAFEEKASGAEGFAEKGRSFFPEFITLPIEVGNINNK